jgi:phosphatidate cytidylyltransferase
LKNLITRTITGTFFTAAIILSAIYSPLAFGLFFMLMALGAMWEFRRLVFRHNNIVMDWPGLLSGLLFYLIFMLIALNQIALKCLGLLPVILLIPLLFQPLMKRKGSWKRVRGDLAAVFIIVLPFAVLNLYLNPMLIPAFHTPWYVLGLFLILWTHDTFAYLSGIMFGKHPLATKVSPKKSVEGSIGGLGFAIVAAYIISIFSPDLNLLLWLVIALIIAFFGTLGDLAESLLKRKAGVKDSGGFFPGHGGILDRFDSIFFVSPIVLILILLSI